MKERLKVLRADPAGNITLFVLSAVPVGRRGQVASRLMDLPAFQAEQVGYVTAVSAREQKPVQKESGAGAAKEETLRSLLTAENVRMEMAGGEFCGNATRAFGLLLAQARGISGALEVSVSGCNQPVLVEAEPTAGRAFAQMPLPHSVERREVEGVPGTLVHLGGIAHFVVHEKPSRVFFAKTEVLFDTIPGLSACGVMFLEADGNGMTPLVKVRATDTLVFEGSCGSGSFAAAVAESQNVQEGIFRKRYEQPAGDLEVEIVRKAGAVQRGSIGGNVRFDEPVEITLEL